MAISTVRPSLSVWERVQLCYQLLVLLPVHVIWSGMPACAQAWSRGLPMRRTLWNAVIRSIMTSVTAKNIHALMPPSKDAYVAWMERVGKNRGFVADIQEGIQGKSRLLWLKKGIQRTSKVVLFFHGGGYVMPLSDGHLEWMAHLLEEAQRSGVRISVAMLEYALVPDSKYPTQMVQAIDGLQTLLEDGVVLSNIVIGGDSAGGHLALSLLAHIHCPRYSEEFGSDLSPTTPGIRSTDKEASLAGAFLVSPLVSFETQRFPSYESNKHVDLLSTYIVTSYGDLLTGGPGEAWKLDQDKGGGWGMALDIGDPRGSGTEQWWTGIQSVVGKILITAGEEEVFRDSVAEFASRLGRALRRHHPRDGMDHSGPGRGDYGRLELILQPKEAHDGPLMDFSAGRLASSTTKAITAFVVSCLN